MSGAGGSTVVSDETTTTRHLIFRDTYCHWLLIRFRIEPNLFEAEAFQQAVGGKADELRKFVTCAPRTTESTDYHLHVSWLNSSKRFSITVEFVKGAKEHASDEHEPYAEQFMQWLAQFVLENQVTGEIHADFRYPIKNWSSRFLLPLKAAIGPDDSEAEIDGISCKLSTRPSGVSKVWLTQEFRNISVHLTAEREFSFIDFDPRSHIAALAEVASRFVKERAERLQ